MDDLGGALEIAGKMPVSLVNLLVVILCVYAIRLDRRIFAIGLRLRAAERALGTTETQNGGE
jgi:hypothetical protein